MKKSLPLLLLLALSLQTTAQDPAREKIKQELAAHPQPDTFRVNRLNEMVFYSRDDSYYIEALTISRKIGYATGEAYALTQLAFSKSRQGCRAQGDSMFDRADSIARKNGNLDLLATGQGTGLGLSLSYDIIKAHSGEIRVKSKEGEGAELIIELTLK